MKSKLLWLIAAAIVILCVAIYRSRTVSNLDVDPHAAQEIEKAKRR